MSLARDIYHVGWENHRQPVEIRLSDQVVRGDPLAFGSLYPSKGFGRLSILMFGVLYTYKELQTMSEDQSQDFVRLGMAGAGRVWSDMAPGLKRSSFGNPK